MKRCILVISMLCLLLNGYAQEKFSPQEFEQKFQAFVTEKVGFTSDESAKFFPLYREFKNKQRANFKKIHQLQRSDLEKKTEEEFRKLNDEILNLEAANLQLEKEYLQKFRKIVSDKKYFMVGWAENSFQRMMLKEARNHQADRGKRTAGGNYQHDTKKND